MVKKILLVKKLSFFQKRPPNDSNYSNKHRPDFRMVQNDYQKQSIRVDRNTFTQSKICPGRNQLRIMRLCWVV